MDTLMNQNPSLYFPIASTAQYVLTSSLIKRQEGKTSLTAEGRKNIKGVESALWSETIRNYKGVEYYLFPKIMGLAERGWHSSPYGNL